MQRVRVRYKGHVQGVGFRATVAHLAQQFDVTGRVSNVYDGTVDLQAEGTEPELLSFLQSIRQQLERYIVESHESWLQVEQGQWPDFSIGADLLQ